MLVIVATVRVKPGKAAHYEDVCARYIPQFRAANPGMAFYTLAKSRDEPDTYRAVEAYADDAALDRHMASDLLKASIADLQGCVAEIDIRRHDAVA